DAGVDHSGLTSVAVPTAVAFVALSSGGEREFMFYGRPAAHDMLSTAAVDAFASASPLSRGDVLHLGSNCLARLPARAASWHALDLAEQAGSSISFDVNLRPALWDQPTDSEVLDVLRPVLRRANLVKLSLDELEFFTGRRSRAATAQLAAELLDHRARLVCVTLGQRGVWYVTRDSSGHVPAPRVSATDATGAGDAFAAVIVTASLADPRVWTAEAPTREALRRACAYAARSTTRPG